MNNPFYQTPQLQKLQETKYKLKKVKKKKRNEIHTYARFLVPLSPFALDCIP